MDINDRELAETGHERTSTSDRFPEMNLLRCGSNLRHMLTPLLLSHSIIRTPDRILLKFENRFTF